MIVDSKADVQRRLMAVQGELPKKANSRAGAGWWMDGAGAWRPPEEWPEDTPPFAGWERDDEGVWSGPEPLDAPRTRSAAASADEARPADEKKKRLSRQARADRRAMLTVVGALSGAALLLIVALVLITQAGASGTGEVVADEAEVIYAAEDGQAVLARRRALAVEAPGIAREQLDGLNRRDQGNDEATFAGFDAGLWVPEATDCLDVSERVLASRSAVAVTWADQLECVADGGLWNDRYLGSTFDSVIDVQVLPIVPVENVQLSGGADWTLDTRQAYLADIEHPPTLHIVAAEGGHNPRAQGPDAWRPSNRNTWCAYAVDWVAVKARWELTVTDAEAAALDDMLQTCGEPESAGADPNSMSENSVAPASIAFG